MEIIGYFLAALVGISLGLIGGGGSILTVPILVYAFTINPVMATSYSLFIVGATSLVGAFNNWRKGLVSIKTALLFGVTSITTVFVTRKFIMPVIPDILFHFYNFEITKSAAIMVLFAVLMLMASMAMIRGRKEPIFTNAITSLVNTTKLLLYGILIGFTGDFGHIEIDWIFLGIITAIAITGIFIGGAIAKKIEGPKLKKWFGWFVLLMGIYIIIKELLLTA